MQVWSLGWEDPLEKGMAILSSILSWRIPWTKEPGGLQSMGSQRVGHDWVANTHTHTHTSFFGSLATSFTTWETFPWVILNAPVNTATPKEPETLFSSHWHTRHRKMESPSSTRTFSVSHRRRGTEEARNDPSSTSRAESRVIRQPSESNGRKSN